MGACVSEGQRMLNAYRLRKKISQAKLAKQCRLEGGGFIHPTSISRYLRGLVRPSYNHMQVIAAATEGEVYPDLWVRPPKQEETAAA